MKGNNNNIRQDNIQQRLQYLRGWVSASTRSLNQSMSFLEPKPHSEITGLVE